MAPLTEYDRGDLPRLSASFAVLGTATDPTTVTFRMREPDGTVTVSVYGAPGTIVIKAGVGSYYVDWSVDQAGEHWWRFEGTGAATSAQEGAFLVRRSRVLS